jgi:hypothetical protein
MIPKKINICCYPKRLEQTTKSIHNEVFESIVIVCLFYFVVVVVVVVVD